MEATPFCWCSWDEHASPQKAGCLILALNLGLGRFRHVASTRDNQILHQFLRSIISEGNLRYCWADPGPPQHKRAHRHSLFTHARSRTTNVPANPSSSLPARPDSGSRPFRCRLNRLVQWSNLRRASSPTSVLVSGLSGEQGPVQIL